MMIPYFRPKKKTGACISGNRGRDIRKPHSLNSRSKGRKPTCSGAFQGHLSLSLSRSDFSVVQFLSMNKGFTSLLLSPLRREMNVLQKRVSYVLYSSRSWFQTDESSGSNLISRNFSYPAFCSSPLRRVNLVDNGKKNYKTLFIHQSVTKGIQVVYSRSALEDINLILGSYFGSRQLTQKCKQKGLKNVKICVDQFDSMWTPI